ncbi:hypothetical protein [Caulobacter sp. BK020]|uniref:hypothetical protein n=1 Tax=Caulobacter sp. BK020 TaxID=2512117 RepID=UPI001051CE4F|nr:hypothetical protein [Caulobacter sp. BK020]TCS11986.1 hypothetical protein EV278_11699 [Caulobacter sp. BK020]
MKVLASIGLTAVCLAASPAVAGPVGTGLTFTEEVAKKALQKKRAAELRSPSDCAAPKAGEPRRADAGKPDGAASETCRAS